jgi:hypothetical protein
MCPYTPGDFDYKEENLKLHYARNFQIKKNLTL